MGYRRGVGAGFNPTIVPTYPVVLDRTHPLAAGLRRFFVPGNTLNDLSGNGAPIASALAGQPGIINSPIGRGFGTPASPSSNAGLVTPLLPGVDLTTGATLWGFRQLIGLGSGSGLPWALALWNSTTDSRALTLYSDNANRNYAGFANGAFVATFANNLINSTLQANAVTWSAGAGSLTAYYSDALFSGSWTGGSGITTLGFNPASHSLWLGTTGNETILAGGLWDRALTPSEIAWLAAEPFAMLRPVVRRTYSVPAVVIPPPAGDELLFHPVF